MGLVLQFLVGDPKGILNALSAADYEKLSGLTEERADFSLHLQPKDLQTLSDCAAQYAGQLLKPLRSALVCYLDEADRGYFLVDDDWVDAMAAIDIGKSKELAAKWFEQMAVNYPNEQLGSPTAEAETAVYELIKLCKYAVQSAKPLIHIWVA